MLTPRLFFFVYVSVEYSVGLSLQSRSGEWAYGRGWAEIHEHERHAELLRRYIAIHQDTCQKDYTLPHTHPLLLYAAYPRETTFQSSPSHMLANKHTPASHPSTITHTKLSPQPAFQH